MYPERLKALCAIALALALFMAWSSLASAQAPTAGPAPMSVPLTGLLQWQTNGVPLVTALGNQHAPQIVTDGAGGAIVVWRDARLRPGAPTQVRLYAQRVSMAGQSLWQPNGIPVTGGAGNPIELQMVSDGQGGAIVAWRDDRSGTAAVYVQRISADGELLWAIDGLQPSPNLGSQLSPRLASDQAGGAFVAWVDYGGSQSSIVRVQRILAAGTFAWGADGVAVTRFAQEQLAPQVISDEAGGVIVAWSGDCTAGWQGLCVQRVQDDGEREWGDQGRIISVSASLYPQIQLLADGAGGAMVVWVDQRTLDDDVYVQRLGLDGASLWASGGVPVITAEGDQELPRIVSDGQNGMIVAWHDTRTVEHGLYLQHSDTSGVTTWGPNGILITQKRQASASAQPLSVSPSATSAQPYFDIASDGANGAMVAWWGYVETGAESRGGIWVQRVAADGTKAWPGAGVLVQWDKLNMGLGVPDLLNDTVGGAIIVWQDNRRAFKSDEYDIFAQRVVEGTHKRYLPFIWR